MLWWIVEDAAFIRVILRRQLEKYFGDELEVVEWVSAKDALAAMAAQSRPPEGMICDVVLPELSGLSLLPPVSAQWPETYVVMISSLPEESWRKHLSAGANYHAFLQKPFSVEQFLQVLQSFQLRWSQSKKEVA